MPVLRSIARFICLLIVGLGGVNAASALERPYILVDFDNGRVLAERNSHQFWYPASVTKLMNAYVTFKALRDGQVTLNTEVIVSAHALAEPPSKMGFKVGTIIDLNNALKMMLVHSSNDIAMAVAETVGGSEDSFVARMNAEAARLGMTSTRFVNPNGLPGPGQATTARDLAVLARALWTEFPERRFLFSIPAIRSGDRVMKSANNLLDRYHGAVGMKTGFICSSGFNIVAVAQRGGRTLAAVVLGSDNAKSRAELTARLLSSGFDGSSQGNVALAQDKGASPVPYAIDMRQDICQRKNRGENEAETDRFDAPGVVSALDDRFALMEPVVVTTLGLRKPDGTMLSADAVAAQEAADAQKAAQAKAAKKQAKNTKKKGKKAEPTVDPALATATGDDGPVAVIADPSPANPATPPASAKSKVKVKIKVQPKPKPKLEVGVPFESDDLAPPPSAAAP